MSQRCLATRVQAGVYFDLAMGRTRLALKHGCDIEETDPEFPTLSAKSMILSLT